MGEGGGGGGGVIWKSVDSADWLSANYWSCLTFDSKVINVLIRLVLHKPTG